MTAIWTQKVLLPKKAANQASFPPAFIYSALLPLHSQKGNEEQKYSLTLFDGASRSYPDWACRTKGTLPAYSSLTLARSKRFLVKETRRSLSRARGTKGNKEKIGEPVLSQALPLPFRSFPFRSFPSCAGELIGMGTVFQLVGKRNQLCPLADDGTSSKDW